MKEIAFAAATGTRGATNAVDIGFAGITGQIIVDDAANVVHI